MHRRSRLVWSSLVALGLSACHGGPLSGTLPAAPGSRALPAAAVSIRLEPIGPTRMTSGGIRNSGKVNAFAIDPKNAKIIYVASGRGTGLETYSSAGIYRTTNGGTSWRAIDNGLTDPQGLISSVVNALWIDPANPSVLLAATEYDGIFRTTDGGSSWRNVYRTTAASQLAAFNGALYAATAAGILTSADDGATWRVQLAGTSARHATAFGQGGSAFYAGTTDGTIYAFSGGTWTKVGRLPYDAHTGTDGSTPAVHQIAVDPLRPTTLYASSNDGYWDQDLHASTDGGHTWNFVLKRAFKIYGNQYGLGTQAIAFSLVHPHMLYVGVDGGMFDIPGTGAANPQASQAASLSVIDVRNLWISANGSDDACWVASDQGLDYEPTCSIYHSYYNDTVVSKTVATGLARRFTVSPDGRTLMVSLQDFDSHVTTDGGAHWTENQNLYEDGFNELQPNNPKICYAFDEATGLQVSQNDCRSYSSPSAEAKNLLPSRLMTTPMAFDPANPTHLYLASGSIVGAGFPAAPKAFFETTDGGATFTKLPWPVNEPGMIVFDPHDGAHIIAGGLRQAKYSSMQVTFDGGKTWKRSVGVPVTGFWYAATISPVNGKVVLATSVDAADNVFVLRSTDGGRTFKRIANVTNAPQIHGPVDHDLLRRALQPPAFVYSPARQILFNQGVTRGTPDVVVTTLRGAFLSTDLGTTWHRLDDALIAHSFWGIRWNKGYLYLGSDGQGVVRSAAPVQ
jgi:hypothetical protein